jgi:hypothetical protein
LRISRNSGTPPVTRRYPMYKKYVVRLSGLVQTWVTD